MGRNRVVYQNWIVELGQDPEELKTNREIGQPPHMLSIDDPSLAEVFDESVHPTADEQRRSDELRAQVQAALQSLTGEEQEFVRLFYYMGTTYRELSEKTGRPVHKLEALHKRVVRKLRRELAPFVEEQYGIAMRKDNDCHICRSPFVGEIDRVIAGHDHTATWRPVIKLLRKKFGLSIRSPQILIAHEKYHRCSSGK